MKIKTQDDFITELAKRGDFTKKDIKLILDIIIELFEETVRDGDELKIRNLGKLYVQPIPERRGSTGEMLPPSTKVNFKLAKNIRFANRRSE